MRASREEAGRCTKSRLICSGQVAEPTSGGCRFPREPAHNGTKDDYANARPFPETFPGRGARESEGDWRSACVKGGRAALRTSGRLCLSWREGWKRLSEAVHSSTARDDAFLNVCGWFIAISTWLTEHCDKSHIWCAWWVSLTCTAVKARDYWHDNYSWQLSVTILLRITRLKWKEGNNKSFNYSSMCLWGKEGLWKERERV